jgi:hypothetical protein
MATGLDSETERGLVREKALEMAKAMGWDLALVQEKDLAREMVMETDLGMERELVMVR